MRDAYGYRIDHGAVVASLNAFAAAAIIILADTARSFIIDEKWRPSSPKSLSTVSSNFTRVGNCISKQISTLESAFESLKYL